MPSPKTRARDVLVDAGLAMVSTDSATQIVRLNNFAYPREVGRIDGLGGRLAWVSEGVLAAVSSQVGNGALRISTLGPQVRPVRSR